MQGRGATRTPGARTTSAGNTSVCPASRPSFEHQHAGGYSLWIFIVHFITYFSYLFCLQIKEERMMYRELNTKNYVLQGVSKKLWSLIKWCKKHMSRNHWECSAGVPVVQGDALVCEQEVPPPLNQPHLAHILLAPGPRLALPLAITLICYTPSLSATHNHVQCNAS